MTAKIIDGREAAREMKDELKKTIQGFGNVQPTLAIILIGNHLPSKVYIKNKRKACEEVGIKFLLYHYPAEIEEQIIVSKIIELNTDVNIHGILLQCPLPPSFNRFHLVNTISPDKDVDGFNIVNIGKLALGIESFIPCTALACLHLIKSVEKHLLGRKVLIIGRSHIVGRPTGQILLHEDCTVTFAHSKTTNLEKECLQNDIIVCAIGKPNVIKSDWLHSNHIVIDVGINKLQEKDQVRTIGDIEFDTAKNVVHAITPVPGGVGPMTIAYLLKNTLKAFISQKNNYNIFKDH